jgi:hypothetical protein
MQSLLPRQMALGTATKLYLFVPFQEFSMLLQPVREEACEVSNPFL